jgi:putative ABC transport system permease protein
MDVHRHFASAPSQRTSEKSADRAQWRPTFAGLEDALGDRAKYVGLLGIAFTSFPHAASYFCGFMTRGFALISENPTRMWVMDPQSTPPTTCRTRRCGSAASWCAVGGAATWVRMRFPNGRFQPFQIIGVDDATLSGVPRLRDGTTARQLSIRGNEAARNPLQGGIMAH